MAFSTLMSSILDENRYEIGLFDQNVVDKKVEFLAYSCTDIAKSKRLQRVSQLTAFCFIVYAIYVLNALLLTFSLLFTDMLRIFDWTAATHCAT